MARILVYTPTYGGMLRPETVASVEAQEFSGTLDYEIDDRDLHEGRSMLEVCEKYRDARQWTLDGGYDALLTVEHDMVLPPDCAQVLWDTPASVVYGAYMLRHGIYVVNLFRYENDGCLGMSYSLYRDELAKILKRKQKAIQVSGAGFGCTLFKRDVLEHIPFGVFEDKPPDLDFASKCVHAGIRQIGRFDVICGHVTPEGDILSLEGGMMNVVRVLALQDVVLNVGDGSKPMKKGRYYSMYLNDAQEAARAGFVRVTNALDEDIPVGREIAVAPAAEVAEKPVAKPKSRKRTTRQKTMSTKNVPGNSD